MATTLAEIRARLKAQENKTSATNATFDNGIYPHWNIAEGKVAALRFLPDADPKNDYFWLERQVIKLPFAGIKGDASSKPLTIQVPCIEMYGKEFSCPILAEVRPWFKAKDPSLDEMGRKYWKKRSYLFQGFVREDPIGEKDVPENPIRRFIISPSIFTIVKSAILDPELEELPTDYQRGLDFKVIKTAKSGGTYADYSTSNWARKETALTEAELEAIEKFGLFNLADFLPKRPGDVELKVMLDMFHASVDGEPYDLEKWGSYYKPYGLKTTDAATTDDVDVADEVPAEPVKPTKAPKAKVEDKDDVSDAKSTGGDRAQAILAAIRNRGKNKE